MDGLDEKVDEMKGDVTNIKTALMEMAKSSKKRGADVSSAIADKSNNSKRKKKVTIAASVKKASDPKDSDDSDDDKPVHNINTVTGASEWLKNFCAHNRS